MAPETLRFENFCCELPHGATIVVNGAIQPHERLVLRGPSGCGKTSLLKFVAGLYPARSGKIFLGPSELIAHRPRESRPGLVFQNGALFEHLSVYENCRVAMDYNPHFAAWSQELKDREILRGLREVSLEDRSAMLAQSLSGGEKQRVALLRCFLASPRYLLLDEPLSALDPKLRQGMQQLILNLLAKNPLPTLIVSHDENEAAVLGTRSVSWPVDAQSSDLRLLF